jgi:hypothetical protein
MRHEKRNRRDGHSSGSDRVGNVRVKVNPFHPLWGKSVRESSELGNRWSEVMTK